MIFLRPCPMMVLLLALGSCEGPPATPTKPTWIHDVYPIIRANCAHCHGPTFDQQGDDKRTRYDFLAANQNACSPLSISDRVVSPSGQTLKIYVTLESESERMPPAPASALSERDIAIITNWQKNGNARGMRSNNKKPELRLLSKVEPNKDGQLVVQFEVTDGDGDQVIGDLALVGQDGAGATKPVAGVGGGKVTFDLGGLSGEQTLHARLCDGQDLAESDLGTLTPP